MKIIIINGPNLNLLGRRQPEIYGTTTFEQYFEEIKKTYPIHELIYNQSNHEGTIIDLLHQFGFSADGIILNAGGYTHTSIAIADAISGIKTPVVEVHISNIYERESFRHISYMKDVCVQSIVGKGLPGYLEAIDTIEKFYDK
jgi:3-dehydroquinate dehydratase II